jgi:hypothetical protein
VGGDDKVEEGRREKGEGRREKGEGRRKKRIGTQEISLSVPITIMMSV